MSSYQPHCVLVVLAVDDLPSLEVAENILAVTRESRYSVMESDGNSFAEISSLTALTRHLGMKTTFYTKYLKANMFVILL